MVKQTAKFSMRRSALNVRKMHNSQHLIKIPSQRDKHEFMFKFIDYQAHDSTFSMLPISFHYKIVLSLEIFSLHNLFTQFFSFLPLSASSVLFHNSQNVSCRVHAKASAFMVSEKRSVRPELLIFYCKNLNLCN